MTPTLSTSTLVNVSSLARPATVVDVSKEKNNFAKIYQDILDKKQEIKDKRREYKEKNKVVTEKNAKLKELEAIYNKIKGYTYEQYTLEYLLSGSVPITSTLTILRFLCVIAFIFIYILYMFAYILYEVHRWLYGQWLYI
jgi:hypothetical protein